MAAAINDCLLLGEEAVYSEPSVLRASSREQ